MTATTVAASRPQSNKQSLWRRFVKGRGLSYCVLAVIGVFWIFPFLWMALGSLKTQREYARQTAEAPARARLARKLREMVRGTELRYLLHQQHGRRRDHRPREHGALLHGRIRPGEDGLRRQEHLVRRRHGDAHGSERGHVRPPVRDHLEHGTRELLRGAHPAVPVPAHRSLPDETVHLRNPRRADGGREGRRRR